MTDARMPGLNPNVPNSARIYDYLLGGKDNYEADREVAHRMLNIAPDTKTLAWLVRQFLVKSVTMAAEAGIRQFIDLGTGIPTSPNVQETARKIHPDARVVCIDNDPIVRAHCDALVANMPGVTALLADIRDPEAILSQLKTDELIDFGKPVAVLAVGVLHFVMDEEDPAGIIARFREVMAPGSYVVLTHASVDTLPEFIDQSHDDTHGSPCQTAYRSQEQTEALLDGFDLIPPGVTTVQEWLDADLPATKLVMYGGIGRHP